MNPKKRKNATRGGIAAILLTGLVGAREMWVLGQQGLAIGLAVAAACGAGVLAWLLRDTAMT
jgi:peptidoglycan biosynthesis protein MviN/MurJ (putative lipid II flippase)